MQGLRWLGGDQVEPTPVVCSIDMDGGDSLHPNDGHLGIEKPSLGKSDIILRHF